MMAKFISYILGFALLLFLQEFVLSAINVYGVVNIYVYIMTILMLPLSVGRVPLLVLGFVMGYVADLVFAGGGLNAICCVWLAFARPLVVNYTLGAESSAFEIMPSASRFGMGKFLIYIFVMCLLFAVPYFLLEMMTFSDIGYTILRTLASTVSTTIFIFLLHLPFGLFKE